MSIETTISVLENPITLGALVTLAGSLIGFLTFIRGKAQAEKDLEHRITKLETRKDCAEDVSKIKEEIAKISAKHDIIWAAIEPSIIGVLHHPSLEYATRDRLLEKVAEKTITETELKQLESMFGCELGNPKNSKEWIAANLMIGRIHQLLFDMGSMTCFN
jgi:hypothetical protein